MSFSRKQTGVVRYCMLKNIIVLLINLRNFDSQNLTSGFFVLPGCFLYRQGYVMAIEKNKLEMVSVLKSVNLKPSLKPVTVFINDGKEVATSFNGD